MKKDIEVVFQNRDSFKKLLFPRLGFILYNLMKEGKRKRRGL